MRASGATDIVYESDQENAVAAVIREALRLSQTPGNPNHGVLVRAVPKVSAVGESASNSRAKRAVQQFLYRNESCKHGRLEQAHRARLSTILQDEKPTAIAERHEVENLSAVLERVEVNFKHSTKHVSTKRPTREKLMTCIKPWLVSRHHHFPLLL